MQRVLVTGATGTIGGLVCSVLRERRYDVRATHRRDRPPAAPAGVEWVRVEDIGPDTAWDAALEDVDYVVHLAAVVRPGPGRAAARETFRVNVDGTRRLAEAVRTRPRIRRFVHVSSIAAVAATAEAPVGEDAVPRPASVYGRSKLAAERAVREVLADAATDWCILRPPLVYGPGSPASLQRLVALVRRGVPLPFRGVGNLRSYCYVGNLADLIARCLTAPGASRRVFGVSDPEPLSTPALVRLLAEGTGRPDRQFRFPVGALRVAGRAGDLLERLGARSPLTTSSVRGLTGSLVVDASAARQALAWRPPFSTAQGLARAFGVDGT